MLRDTTIGENSLTDHWDSIAERLIEAADENLGTERPRDRDWFNENSDAIKELLRRKNDAYTASLCNLSSSFLRQQFSRLRAQTQARLYELENK